MTAPRPALLLTRPWESSRRFAAMVSANTRPGPVVISPLMRIVPRGGMPDLTDVSGVILSSSHAARSEFGASGLPAFCVGTQTTGAARAAGFDAKPCGNTAEDLVASLIEFRPAGRLMHLRGEYSRGNIAGRLTAAGLHVAEHIVYVQEALPLTQQAHDVLDGERPVILPLFSPRTARLLCEQISGRARRWVVAMSPAVAKAALPLGAEHVAIAETPTGAAMCAVVSGLYQGPQPVEGGQGNA